MPAKQPAQAKQAGPPPGLEQPLWDQLDASQQEDLRVEAEILRNETQIASNFSRLELLQEVRAMNHANFMWRQECIAWNAA
eukprot:12688343-Alexandrium_andersonii.AAC.1